MRLLEASKQKQADDAKPLVVVRPRECRDRPPRSTLLQAVDREPVQAWFSEVQLWSSIPMLIDGRLIKEISAELGFSSPGLMSGALPGRVSADSALGDIR